LVGENESGRVTSLLCLRQDIERLVGARKPIEIPMPAGRNHFISYEETRRKCSREGNCHTYSEVLPPQ
jgi:hypothetical protein